MISRRQFFGRAIGGSAALVAATRLAAQQQNPRGAMHDSSVVRARDSSNLFAMDQGAAVPVRLPPKPNATPLLDDKQRDDLEHRIHCQCGCTLDVYTCRTTDFSCQVSPAMHRDVVSLINGGYSAQEILDAFVGVYGDRARMAPRKSGFDLVAWIAPGAAVVIGGAVLATLLRSWGRRARSHAPATNFVATRGDTDATPEELARLEAAVRGEGDA
jgi:cytochrome c-type biogenesis protein CcmH